MRLIRKVAVVFVIIVVDVVKIETVLSLEQRSSVHGIDVSAIAFYLMGKSSTICEISLSQSR